MNDDPIEKYLNQVKARLNQIPPQDRPAILAEMRNHLSEKTADLRRGDPHLSKAQAVELALRDFGHPEELTVASGAGSSTVRRRTGEIVLSVAKATGRGIGKTFMWVGIILGGLLVLGIGTSLTLLYLFQDDIRENLPHRVYAFQETYDAKTGTESGAFELGGNVKSATIGISILEGGVGKDAGCATVIVRSPTGATLFDNTGNCDSVSRSLSITQAGRYDISYRMTAFSGSIQITVDAFERA